MATARHVTWSGGARRRADSVLAEESLRGRSSFWASSGSPPRVWRS